MLCYCRALCTAASRPTERACAARAARLLVQLTSLPALISASIDDVMLPLIGPAVLCWLRCHLRCGDAAAASLLRLRRRRGGGAAPPPFGLFGAKGGTSE